MKRVLFAIAVVLALATILRASSGPPVCPRDGAYMHFDHYVNSPQGLICWYSHVYAGERHEQWEYCAR